jgi:hypothetical protein
LSDDFRSRIWEEKVLGLEGKVDSWDLGAYRLSAARIKILCDDASLLQALEDLTNSGKRLGGNWQGCGQSHLRCSGGFPVMLL